MLLALLVLPAGYAMWRRHQNRTANTVTLLHGGTAAAEGGA